MKTNGRFLPPISLIALAMANMYRFKLGPHGLSDKQDVIRVNMNDTDAILLHIATMPTITTSTMATAIFSTSHMMVMVSAATFSSSPTVATVSVTTFSSSHTMATVSTATFSSSHTAATTTITTRMVTAITRTDG